MQIVGEKDFKKILISFNYQRKRKNNRFTYYIPSIYLPLFRKYISELQTKNVKTKCFLQNWNVKVQKRIQQSGENLVKNLHKTACKILKISPEIYTIHCWRRSVATNLANKGVSFINLKQHGQWNSDAVVEGYIANSEPIRRVRDTRLLPASLVAPDPSPPPKPNDIPSFTNLQGFLQLYDNKLAVDYKIDPDLPLSQQAAKQHQIDASTKAAENRGMTIMEVNRRSEKEGKMVTKEVFGKGATFQNCLFVFYM